MSFLHAADCHFHPIPFLVHYAVMAAAKEDEVVEAGLATANFIDGAEVLVFEGMGHDLAKGLWPEVVDAIARHAGR